MKPKIIHFCKLWVDDFYYGYVPVEYAMERLEERQGHMKRLANHLEKNKCVLCAIIVKSSLNHVVEMKIMQDIVLKDEMQLMIKRNRRKDGKQYREFVIEERRRRDC